MGGCPSGECYVVAEVLSGGSADWYLMYGGCPSGECYMVANVLSGRSAD